MVAPASGAQRQPRPAFEARNGAAGRIAALCALSAMLAFGSHVALGEWHVRQAARALSRLDAGEALDVASSFPADRAGPPRIDLSVALVEARQAASLSGADRRAMLDRAEARLDRALASRPHWGEAWITKTYVSYLRSGRSAETRAALARSYADLPFAYREGMWRTRYALLDWSALDPATRLHAAQEAAWLSETTPSIHARMTLMVQGTPLYPFYAREDARLRSRS